MPTNHQAVVALPQAGDAVKQQLRSALVGKFPYVVASAAAAADLVAVDPWTGDVIQDLILFGRVYSYDATDTTTPHDGTTCLVSSDGKRYKLASNIDVVAYAVLSVTPTPPGSPALGDAYLVGAAATGAWSGHDDQVAVYTARGWEFISYAIGRLLYIRATNSYKRRDSGGAWGDALTVAANSITPDQIVGRPLRYIVENQTTNTPPGSPSDGDQYIIGAAPTGAWAGNAGKIALWSALAATWKIIAPREGETAYDKSLDHEVTFNGSTWAGATDASALIYAADFGGGSSIDLVNGVNGIVFDSTYNEYVLHLTGLKTANNDVTLALQVTTDGGSTWKTSGYRDGVTGVCDSGNMGTSFSSQRSFVSLSWPGGLGALHGVGNKVGGSYQAIIWIWKPAATDYPKFGWQATYDDGNTPPQIAFANGAGKYGTAGAINGIRIVASSGNIIAAHVMLEGKRKA
jgi:hypothetical protein